MLAPFWAADFSNFSWSHWWLFFGPKNGGKIIKMVGFLLINKPRGMTSHDVVDKLRELTGIKKIGHAGTLDPFARGLLILGISRDATKKISKFLTLDKEYIATLKLGAESDTFDREGKIFETKIEKVPTLEEVEETLKSFLGEIEQTPPPFSAKKIRGKKAYALARKKERVKLKPQRVKIYQISILEYKFPFLKIKVNCSSGTYIRSLTSDIGKKLKCGAYLEDLIRTKIGKFSLKNTISLSRLDLKNWQKYLIQC